MYIYIYLYIYTLLDLRSEVIRNFCELSTHFSKVICNCDS